MAGPFPATHLYREDLGKTFLLLVPNRCLHFRLKLRRRFPNPMRLRMFHGVLQDLLFSVSANDMLAPGRWIDLGTFNDFTHGEYLLEF